MDNQDSYEFQRFIKVYNAGKHVLKEREQQILDDLYGVTKPRVTLKKAGIPHNIKQERVRQVRHRAELKIVKSMLKHLKGY
ncbi:sigma factor-like helix-turn-helix DNA-binding protein [Virgibacillus natechei]